MEEAEQFEKEEVPAGQNEELDAQGTCRHSACSQSLFTDRRTGLLQSTAGDYLFGRNKLGSRRAEDDVLIAWSVGG